MASGTHAARTLFPEGSRAVRGFPFPASRGGPDERLESPAECSFIRKSGCQSHF